MKILLCIPSLQTAGAEKFVVDLSVYLKNKGIDVVVAITRLNIVKEYGEILKKNNIRVVDLSSNNFFGMLYKQIRFFSKEKPDIVHTNVGSLFHIMLVTKIFNIKGRIYTIHNEAKLLYGNSKIRKKIYQMAFSYFEFEPVAICGYVKKSFLESFGEKYKFIKIVNNGVDLKNFYEKTQRSKTNKEEIVFINIGTMYWIKNQIEIIEAFSEVYLKYNNIKLLILGDGEEREKLKKIILEKRLENVILMPGVVKNVYEYLQEADIYVSASLTEGLPLSMLEAMACGLPIITSNAGGSIDIVKNNINGIIYCKKDVEELKKAMEELIINGSKRKIFSYNSQKIVKNWSMDNCGIGYLNIYKDLLCKKDKK